MAAAQPMIKQIHPVLSLIHISGIPCVGSGTTASAVCMDKQITHALLESNGIHTARFLVLHQLDCPAIEQVDSRIKASLDGYPVFVKPANAGSSVGVTKVHSCLLYTSPPGLHRDTSGLPW